MATGKNTKGKANGGGSRAHARYSGLMALESRVLFSAAPLMADLPGLESAHDGAPAIEASLLPGDKFGVGLGQINGLVPTPPGEAENQVPGLVPTPEKHLTHHQSKGAHLNQFAPKKHTHSIINPDSMRPVDDPILTPGIGQFAFRGLNPIQGSVIMTTPAGGDEPEGSNPTPHPMPVSELSDSVSKRRLEHGPGLHDAQRVGLSVGPIVTRGSSEDQVPNDDDQSKWVPQDAGDAGIWTDGTMTNLKLQIGSEHFPPPGLHDSILDSVEVVDPDSMRPAANSFRGCIPTEQPFPASRHKA